LGEAHLKPMSPKVMRAHKDHRSLCRQLILPFFDIRMFNILDSCAKRNAGSDDGGVNVPQRRYG
jgi:hypothetical protein